MNWESVGAEGF